MTFVTQQYSDPDQDRKKRIKRLVVSVLLISLGVHAAGALIAAAIIVARHLATPPVEFKSAPNNRLPAKIREHKLAMAASNAAAPKPIFHDRLQSHRPAPFALPSLPKLPTHQTPPLDLSALLSFTTLGSSGAGGIGADGTSSINSGSTGTGGKKAANIQFLGVETQSSRIVLMFDISKTVSGAAARAGLPMERIRDETCRLIDSLGINTRFGLVEFARNYAFFAPELIPASELNRDAARHWLMQHFATTGVFPKGVPNTVNGSPGFLAALEQTFLLRPDTVFILSDCDFQRGSSRGTQIASEEISDSLRRLQSSLPRPAQIHVIGVGVTQETERKMRSIISSHGGGGRLSELKK
jgi:hypothetical protein